jgi:hypothetical protein
MRQLKDRITHSFRTRPLTADEAGSYIAFRMRAAGYKGRDVFTPAAVSAIARSSSGLTRRINVLCDKSLLAAFAGNTHAVTPREVRAAIADSDFAPVPGRRTSQSRLIAGALLVASGAVAGAGAFYWLDRAKPEPMAPAPVAQPLSKPDPAPAPAAAAPANEPGKEAPADAGAPATTVPATPPVVEKPPPAPLLAPEQLRRLEGYAAGRNPMLRDRIAGAREKLENEPDTSYSIELFVAENSDAARAERFLARARDLVPLSDVYVIPVATGARYFLKVTYGAYATKEAAAAAAGRLPPKYQNAFRFELRSFAELRAAI